MKSDNYILCTDQSNLQNKFIKVWLTLFKTWKQFLWTAKIVKHVNRTHWFKFKDPKKKMALGNLSVYYTWKNIKSEHNNNQFEISASA